MYAVWAGWPHHCANWVHNPQSMNVLSQQQPKGLGQWTWDAKSCLGKHLVCKDTRFFYIKGSVWVLLFRKHLVYINATYGICASPLSNFPACVRESAHISKTLCYQWDNWDIILKFQTWYHRPSHKASPTFVHVVICETKLFKTLFQRITAFHQVAW